MICSRVVKESQSSPSPLPPFPALGTPKIVNVVSSSDVDCFFVQQSGIYHPIS